MINHLLLCIGAQKSGTTWLYSSLRKSQNIEFYKYKEIHYFDYVSGHNKQLKNRIINDISKSTSIEKLTIEKHINSCDILPSSLNNEWYENLFTGGKKYSADFTPEYALLKKDEMKRIKDVSKEQKIIFIMRDPIKRAISALQYFYQNNNLSLEKASEDELIRKTSSKLILSRSRYQDTITTVDSTFEDSDVLYLFYEEVMENKTQALKSIEKFLDINLNMPHTNDIEKIVNGSQKHEFPPSVYKSLEKELRGTYKFIKNRFGYIPQKWSNYEE